MAGRQHPDPASSPGSTGRPPDMPAFEPVWLPPPADHRPLAPDEVHLWRGTLDAPSETVRDMAGALSTDERERAGRIVFDRARERFIAGRFLLRTILGRYLLLPAQQIELTYGEHGKPELAPRLSTARLQFSLAHSENRALVAVTCDRAIGVDVERLRPLVDMDGLAMRIFSATERAEWDALPPGQKLQGFFRGWTAKEAWLKARATGLTWPPDWFSVPLTPGTPLRLLDVAGEPGAPERWALVSFEVATGYLGALAVEGCGWRFGCFDHSSQLTPAPAP